jgi:hypothetical protein
VSLAGAEIPDPGDGGNESLPVITKLNRGLYMVVLYILGTALILLILGWIIITAVGKQVPDGMPVVIATIVGALVGVIATGNKSSP